jgi:hypothetical protein
MEWRRAHRDLCRGAKSHPFSATVESADFPIQAVLFKLFLQQLELISLSEQQFAKISRHIEWLRQLIAKQVELIEELRLGGQDCERPMLVLATLNQLLAIYQTHRQRTIAAIASGCPGADSR